MIVSEVEKGSGKTEDVTDASRRSCSVLKTGKTLNDKFNKKDFNVFSALIHLEDVLTLFPTRCCYVPQGRKRLWVTLNSQPFLRRHG